MVQRFWFAHPGERLALCLPYQLVDPIDHALVLLLPIEVVFPYLVSEKQFHFASFRSAPLPAFNCATPARRRFALAGVRKR